MKKVALAEMNKYDDEDLYFSLESYEFTEKEIEILTKYYKGDEKYFYKDGETIHIYNSLEDYITIGDCRDVKIVDFNGLLNIIKENIDDDVPKGFKKGIDRCKTNKELKGLMEDYGLEDYFCEYDSVINDMFLVWL